MLHIHKSVFRMLRTALLSLVFTLVGISSVEAACSYYFKWSCPGCGNIGGKTSGTEGPYSSMGQCNSARSRIDSTVSARGCYKQGSCQGTGPGGPGPDDAKKEEERKQQEEAAKLKQQQEAAERQRQFDQDKNEALGQLKGLAGESGDIPELKGGTSGFDSGLKTGTTSSQPGLKGGSNSSGLGLKQPTFSRGTRNSVVVDLTGDDGSYFSDTQGPICPVGMVLASIEGGAGTCERVTVNSNQLKNDLTNALDQGEDFVAESTKTFSSGRPVVPNPIRGLDASLPGDIILVGPNNSSGFGRLLGAALGLFEGVMGNEKDVTHVLVYIGEQSGRKLFLDNQGFDISGPRGPVIISELEFRQRYGERKLYSSRPTKAVSDQMDGTELWRAALGYAQSNQAAINRGSPIGGTKYGLFGKDNVICSESSLMAIVKATGGKVRLEDLIDTSSSGKVEGFVRQFIDAMPGDIYDAHGNGYFTLRPLEIGDQD